VADDDFDRFYAASYDRLLRQLFVVTGGDLAEAEDVLQEAYARALARWRTVGHYDAPEAWVRRVAINLAGMTARRLRSRAKALLRLGDSGQVPELSPDWVDLAAALRQVPLAQREALVLHHMAGLTVEEVAAQLGAPAGTVKTRLARGRAALARQLGAQPTGEVLA
jgi:RNA polymerase sigma-70 factor, ECF subfamily